MRWRFSWMPAGDLSSSALDGSDAPRGPETGLGEMMAISSKSTSCPPRVRPDNFRVARHLGLPFANRALDALLHCRETNLPYPDTSDVA